MGTLLFNFYRRNLFTGFGQKFLILRTMHIKNFIFLDSETTGLPSQEYNTTRITELTLISVECNHVSLGVFPRVQNKLTLCFNPRKMINPEASRLTGMFNDLLEFQSTFDKRACTIINDFLALQAKPLCFVAHNGNYFDYPILKAEFNRVGCQVIDEDILCIDSLQAFRELDREESETLSVTSPVIIENVTNTSNTQNEISINEQPTQQLPIEFCDDFDEILYNAVENIESTYFNTKETQNINESTPKKKHSIYSSNTKIINTEVQDKMYYMPSTSSSKENKVVLDSTAGHKSQSKASTARKKLNFGKNTYRLIDVYTRLTDKTTDNAHKAEHDVNMLIECAATLGERFVNWANTNAKKFSDIPMMKSGRKLGT